MKRFLLALIALMTILLPSNGAVASAPKQKQSTAISSIEKKGAWYYLYDERGKNYKCLSVRAVGRIEGFSSTFFIAQKGSWYELYDANGRNYKSMSIRATGTILSVSGNTFTARNGAWIDTYDKSGKKTSSRSARY